MGGKYKRLSLLLILIISFLLMAGCSGSSLRQRGGRDNPGLLVVHFVDVGQADFILIKAPEGRVMVIDAGNNGDAEMVVDYLKKQGVTRIDYLIGTHPHEDHIGGMDKVIENFDVSNFYMPKVSTTTKTYKDVINAAKSKNLSINTAKGGVSMNLGSGIDTKMLAPLSDKYEELNDYSAVIKLVYNDASFLFTGDAEKVSEQQMIKKGLDLSAQVLKVGHHGSNSSTAESFLDAVNPKYAVISVGKDNDYGHPESLVLDRLKIRGIKIFRTDESGTIIVSTDGRDINID